LLWYNEADCIAEFSGFIEEFDSQLGALSERRVSDNDRILFRPARANAVDFEEVRLLDVAMLGLDIKTNDFSSGIAYAVIETTITSRRLNEEKLVEFALRDRTEEPQKQSSQILGHTGFGVELSLIHICVICLRGKLFMSEISIVSIVIKFRHMQIFCADGLALALLLCTTEAIEG